MFLQWSQHARKDMLALIRYIAQDNPDAALQMNILLRNAAEGLLRFPMQGRLGRVQETRELVVHSTYILVYSVVDNLITILAVIHTSRQYYPD